MWTCDLGVYTSSLGSSNSAVWLPAMVHTVAWFRIGVVFQCSRTINCAIFLTVGFCPSIASAETYHMVDSDETSLICWAPGGDSFMITDADKFAEVCNKGIWYLFRRDVPRDQDLIQFFSFHFTDRPTKVFQAFQVHQLCPTAKLLRISENSIDWRQRCQQDSRRRFR